MLFISAQSREIVAAVSLLHAEGHDVHLTCTINQVGKGSYTGFQTMGDLVPLLRESGQRTPDRPMLVERDHLENDWYARKNKYGLKTALLNARVQALADAAVLSPEKHLRYVLMYEGLIDDLRSFPDDMLFQCGPGERGRFFKTRMAVDEVMRSGVGEIKWVSAACGMKIGDNGTSVGDFDDRDELIELAEMIDARLRVHNADFWKGMARDHGCTDYNYGPEVVREQNIFYMTKFTDANAYQGWVDACINDVERRTRWKITDDSLATALLGHYHYDELPSTMRDDARDECVKAITQFIKSLIGR